VEVVLVDDAEDVRQVVKSHLRHDGRFVVVAEGGTGAEAIALARAHKPLIMVLDASMPDMDGLEALPGILEASPNTQVAVLSGFGGQALELAAMELGATLYIEKRQPIRELPNKLAQLIPAGSRPETPQPALADDAPIAPEDAAEIFAEHLERFRTVFDQAAIGMATMTLTGSVVRVNDAMARVLGGGDRQLIGRSYAHLAADVPTDLAVAVSGVASGSVDVVEVDHRLTREGDRRALHSTLTVVRDSASRPLYLFCQAEDVTERTAALEELRRGEERFRLLVEGVRDYAIFLLDKTGHVSTWNAGAERMKRYTADEILGRHFRTFYPQHAQDARHPEHELEVALREGRYEEEGWRVRRDGTTFWANVVITALFDSRGEHIGFAKVTRDVTERRQALEALEAAAAQTAEFVTITAHELQSPIAAVSGAADLLDAHWTTMQDAERAALLANINRGATTLRHLLDDLLMASRLGSGSFHPTTADHALTAILADAVADLNLPPDAVVLDCPQELQVRADRLRLQQILSNLLTNAVKYGATPIVISAGRTDGTVEIRVTDSGEGIPAELEPRLFERFARGAGRRDRGTGLGLFIVRELARVQGGDARYEATEGGARFVVTLRAAHSDVVTPEEPGPIDSGRIR
jgi:PAS domain S-box-containing protein